MFGAELSLELPKPQNGEPDPVGAHLLVLARGEEGYHRLAGAITHAQLQGQREGPARSTTSTSSPQQADGHFAILTGCRKGAVRRALAVEGADAAPRRSSTSSCGCSDRMPCTSS